MKKKKKQTFFNVREEIIIINNKLIKTKMIQHTHTSVRGSKQTNKKEKLTCSIDAAISVVDDSGGLLTRTNLRRREREKKNV